MRVRCRQHSFMHGPEEPLGCTNYLLSIAPQGSCPMENSHITTFATRTNCGQIDDVVISSSRKQVPLKIYCDGKLKSQFVMVSPVQTISTRCEIREIVGDKIHHITPVGQGFIRYNHRSKTDRRVWIHYWVWLVYSPDLHHSHRFGDNPIHFFMICDNVFCLKTW